MGVKSEFSLCKVKEPEKKNEKRQLMAARDIGKFY